MTNEIDTKKNNSDLNTSLLNAVANTDTNSSSNPVEDPTPAVTASTQLVQYVHQGWENILYCLNGISPYLPTKTQMAMTALVFQAALNALPMLVAEIIIEDEIRGDAKASLLEIVGPAVAIMLFFAPAEAIQTYLHSTWRAINDHEPDIASMGARSLSWVLTLLVPSLISSFVSGALTAKAGFSDPSMQAFMAVLLGTANMIKTLLGSIIPEWRILAHIKQLAPLNMQPIVERLFQPDVLDFFKTLYAKLAPPIMGAVYANFVYAEVIDNVPEVWPLGIILAIFVLESCAETTKDFDVMQVVESCEAFAKALAEALALAAAAAANAQALALEAGDGTPSVVENEDANATNYSLSAIAQAVHNTVSPCVTAVTPYASAGYQAVSPYATLLSKFVDEISGKFVVDTLHNRGMSTESIAKTMAAGLFIATYCIVTQAIKEYVLNDEGTATLGAKYLGTERTAAASDTIAATVVIAAVAILLGSIQALSKYPFMKEILEKRFAAAAAAPNEGAVIVMDSVTPPAVLTTGNNIMTTEPTLDTDTVPRVSDETKTALDTNA